MARYDPIAYTYDADHHCESCALARFGRDERGDIVGTDSEGNEIGAVAPWDEWWTGDNYECEVMCCGDCDDVITRTCADPCTC